MAQKKGTLALSMLVLNAAILQGCGMPDPSAGFEVSSKFANSLASVSASETDDTSGSAFEDDLRSEPWIPVGDSQTTARIPITPGQLTPPTTTQPTQPPPSQPVVTQPVVTQPVVTQPTTTPATSYSTPVAGMPAPLSSPLAENLDCQYMLSYLGWNTTSSNTTVTFAGGASNHDIESKMPNVGDRAYESEAIGISFSKLGSPRPGADQNEIRIFGMLIQNSKLSLQFRDGGNTISVPQSAYSSIYNSWYPGGKPTDEPIRFVTSNGYDLKTAASVKLSRAFYEANLKNASNVVTAELSCNNRLVTSAPLDLTDVKMQMRGMLLKLSNLPSYDYVYGN